MSVMHTLTSFNPNAPMYVLELHVPGKKTEATLNGAMLLPHVSSFRMMRTPATQITHTLAGRAYRSMSGYQRQVINIGGRSGMDYRLGSDKNGGITFDSGANLFREFEAFIENYIEKATIATNASHNVQGARSRLDYIPYLVLRCMQEKEHWRVEPTGLTMDRNSKVSRLGYEYQLQLVAYEKDEPLGGFLMDMMNAADSIMSFANKSAAFVAYGNAFVQQSTAAFDDIVLNAFRDLSRLLEEVVAFGASTEAATLGSVRNTCMEAFRIGQQGVLALEALLQITSGGGFTLEDDENLTWFREASLKIGETRRDCLKTLGALGIPGTPEVFDNDPNVASIGQKDAYVMGSEGPLIVGPKGASLPTLAGTLSSQWGFGGGIFTKENEAVDTKYGIYPAEKGDNWKTIAEKVGAGLEEIMSMNGASHVDYLGPGQPFFAGAPIIIPLGGASPAKGLKDTASMYGIDLRLSDDGDLIPLGDVPKTAAVITGPPLIEQSLGVRLRTVQGNSVFEDYGLPRLVGDKGVYGTAGMFVAHARNQILSDWRIDEIKDIKVQDNGDGLVIDCTAETSIGVELSMLIPQV